MAHPNLSYDGFYITKIVYLIAVLVQSIVMSIKIRSIYILFAVIIYGQNAAIAMNESKATRFATIGTLEANVRAGPGSQYPIIWQYIKQGLPVEIIAEYENWRKVKDHDGSVGWVLRALLSAKRNAIITDGVHLLYSSDSSKSNPMIKIEAGVIVNINKCRKNWCAITVNDYNGWIEQEYLWGTYLGEIIE